MARIALFFGVLITFAICTPLNAADEVKISPGVITAKDVEITTDTGEVLDQRLGVGDSVYVIRGGKKKKGWERISRSAGDAVGIGWIQSQFVQTFQRWEAPASEPKPTQGELTGEKTVFAPDVEPVKAGQVGVLPFAAASPNDPVARWAYDAFGMSLKNNGRFQVVLEALKAEKVNPESPETVQSLINKYKLDGVFIGNLSGDMGQMRLLQIKYFAKGREAAVLEKVKKIPKEGNLKEIIDSMAVSCAAAISSNK